MPPLRLSPFWWHIDGVLAISLDSRLDRREQLAREFADIIPPEKFHFLPAVSGKEIPGFGQRPWFRKGDGRRDANQAGRAGCVLSHRQAIAHARAARWKTVLILEDDAMLAPGSGHVLAHLHRFLDAPGADGSSMARAGIDVCYLGFTAPRGPTRHIASLGPAHDLHQIYGCLCTHAYLLRDTTCDWLLKRLPDEKSIWPWIARHRAIDRWYARNLARRLVVLAVSPGILAQRASHSDITGRLASVSRSADFTVTLPCIRRSGMAWQYHARLYSFRMMLATGYDRLRAARKRMCGL
ncbi:MAG: glycosyltransferase family 25 protein [Opitutaceae bacterium]|jgi:hypothetical protein|nr:glycosyltransferase family 25 protein [Opitutaceae bacterium]